MERIQTPRDTLRRIQQFIQHTVPLLIFFLFSMLLSSSLTAQCTLQVDCSSVTNDFLFCRDDIPDQSQLIGILNSCGSTSVTYRDTDNGGRECDGSLVVTRTYTVTDDNNTPGDPNDDLTETCVADYTIHDNQPPQWDPNSYQQIVYFTCAGDIGVPDAPRAIDNCNGATVSIVSDRTTYGDCDDRFSREIGYQAVDGCGNISSILYITLNVYDDVPPRWNIGPGELDETYTCAEDLVRRAPSASDNCAFNDPIVNLVSDVITNSSCTNRYTRTMIYEAVDECGNVSDPYVVTLHVNDNVGPRWDPNSYETILRYQCEEDVVMPDPQAFDNCMYADVNVRLVHDVTTPNGGCDNSYTRELGYEAEDGCGNTSAILYITIIVRDETGPTWITRPGAFDVNFTCAADAYVPTDIPEAIDNCDNSTVTVTRFSNIVTRGNCEDRYVRVITYIATDECGYQSDPYTVTVTVNDDVPPTWDQLPGDLDRMFTCAADVVLPDPPTAVDNCPDNDVRVVLIDDTTTPGVCDDQFVRVLTYEATDECGNAAQYTVTITVHDDVPPTWDQIPGDLDRMFTCAADVVLPDPPTATDNCPDNSTTVSVISDITNPGGCDDRFVRVITYEATDECGNASIPFRVIIYVNDDVAPTWDQQPGDLDRQFICAADVRVTPPTATDNCPDNSATVSVVSDITTPSGVCDDRFVRVITYEATDECGNISIPYVVTITVFDDIAPTWDQQPGDLDRQYTCAADVMITPPTATDNCPDNSATVSVVSDITTPSGVCDDRFVRVITYEATDECGNVSIPYVVTITVFDDVAPTWDQQPGDLDVMFTCAADVIVPNPPTATDNCPDNTATVALISDITTPSGVCDDRFVRVLTYEATDECGNVSVPYTVTITVFDDVAPTWDQQPGDLDVMFTCAADVIVPNPPTATDNCPDNTATVALISDVTTPSGVCDDRFVRVLTYEATDECGNVSVPYTVTITVFDDVAPTWDQQPGDLDVMFTCAADVIVPNPPTATDNCPDNVATVALISDITTPSGVCDDRFVRVLTYEATDECGNVSVPYTVTITVFDDVAPTWDQQPGDLDVMFTCAADVIVPNPPTATDNCPDNVATVALISDVTTPSGVCDDRFVRVLTYEATDECGNVSVPYTVTITVFDDVAPTWDQQPGDLDVMFTCAADVIVPNPPTATDNCPDNVATVALISDVTTPSGVCDDRFVRVLTYEATDECGNVSIPYTVTITVFDDVAPTWDQQPGDLDVMFTCAADVIVPNPPTATDNCPDNVATVALISDVTTPSGVCDDRFVRVLTYEATDECGNVSVPYTVTITVFDDVAPTWDQQPGDLDVMFTCAADVIVPNPPTATDNCPDNVATVALISDVTTPSGVCDDRFVRVLTYEATDECGNVSVPYTVTITVFDDVAPTWDQQPGDLDVMFTCAADVIVPNPPTATDNCPDNVATVALVSDVTTPSGVCDDRFVRVLTYEATDECGNVSVPYTVTITVFDDVAPTWDQQPGDLDVMFTCAADVIVPNPPTATDNCPDNVATVALVSDVTTPSGVCDDRFVRVLTYEATDECGNVSVPYTVTITVFDDVAPTWDQQPGDLDVMFTCAADVIVPNPPTATDNCPDNVATVALISDVTTPSGVCDDRFVRVLTYEATDECGNVSVPYTVTITVFDDVAPTWDQQPGDLDVMFTCAADVIVPNPPTATDNCPDNVATVALVSDVTTPSGVCDDRFVRVLTYEATDECGNVSVPYTVTITVFDDVAPTWDQQPGDLDVMFSCAEDVVVPDDPTATDNCPNNIATVTLISDVTTPGSCVNDFVRVRTYEATDECGNVSVPFTVTITVLDDIPPTVSCPSDQTVTCVSDIPPPDIRRVTEQDNCIGVVTVTFVSDVSNGQNCPEIIIRTYRATDICGNSADCTQEFTILNDGLKFDKLPDPIDDITCLDDLPEQEVVTASTNCEAATVTATVDPFVVDECNDYPVTYRWVASDECGNTVTETRTFFVRKVEFQAICLNPVVRIECKEDVPELSINDLDWISCNDDVELVTINGPIVEGMPDCPNTGYIYEYYIRNGCGEYAHCSREFILESPPPVVECRKEIWVDCVEDIVLDKHAPGTKYTISCGEADTLIRLLGPLNPAVGRNCPWQQYQIEYSLLDGCERLICCLTTVNVRNPEPVFIGLPGDTMVVCGEVPAVPDVTAASGCEPDIPVTFDETIEPVAGTDDTLYIRTWTATDSCGRTITQTQEILEVCTEFCSFTSNFYGNPNSQSGGRSVEEILGDLVGPANPLVVGVDGRSITFEEPACILELLPGSTTDIDFLPRMLGDVVLDDPTCDIDDALLGSNGQFNNALLVQTITLSLNTRFDTNFCNLMLIESCFDVDWAIYSHLDFRTATVCDLVTMANEALARQYPTEMLPKIEEALRGINEFYANCNYRFCPGMMKKGKPGMSNLVNASTRDFEVKQQASANGGYLELWPNPTNVDLQVKVEVPRTRDAMIRIFDAVGRLQYQSAEILVKGTNRMTISVQDLMAGTYLLSVETEDAVLTKRFIRLE